eukprot:1733504-Amphidinium_carterae.1
MCAKCGCYATKRVGAFRNPRPDTGSITRGMVQQLRRVHNGKHPNCRAPASWTSRLENWEEDVSRPQGIKLWEVGWQAVDCQCRRMRPPKKSGSGQKDARIDASSFWPSTPIFALGQPPLLCNASTVDGVRIPYMRLAWRCSASTL